MRCPLTHSIANFLHEWHACNLDGFLTYTTAYSYTYTPSYLVAWHEPNLVGDAAWTIVIITPCFSHSLIACMVAHLLHAPLIISLLSQLPDDMMLSPSSADWSIYLHATHFLIPSLKSMNPLLAQLRALSTKLATTLYSSNALTECWNACPLSSFKLSHSLSLPPITYLPTCFLRLVLYTTYLLTC